MNHWAVVLAGGVGSRFWPLSTPERPKQLLPLVTSQPLLADAITRLRPLIAPERTLILTSAGLAGAVAAVARDVPKDNILAEPTPRGTGPALAWAALEIERRAGADAIMSSVHADWAVGDAEGFRDTLRRAAAAAMTYKSLVTVGIVPDRADPGFGYIEPGPQLEEGVRRVTRFVEKPTRPNAERMWRSGFLWNSGIFVWRVGDFLDEIRAHTPEVARALASGGRGMRAEEFFTAVTPVTVDVGVLERSSRVLVLPGDFGWDDVGTWGALRRLRAADPAGNASSGDVHAVDASGNVVLAEGNTVVLFGVSDLVVVSRNGLTLVTTVDRSADLKSLVESLPAPLRDPA
ncbi:MAG: mannose-1-phosphate guanylyltransferase [Gemmatimonadaceae bacterium]